MGAKSGYNKAKELTNKGVDATKKAIHDKKRQVAKDVLRELAYDVSDKDSKSLIRSWNIVDDKYAKGGAVGQSYNIQNIILKKGDKFQVSDDSSIYTFDSVKKNERFGFDEIIASSDWENKVKPIWRIDTMESNDLYIKKYAKGGGVGNKYAKEDKAMLHNQNKEIMHHSKEMEKIINKQKHIEPFVVAKMNRATTDLSDLTHYLDGDKKAKGGNLGFTYSIGGL
jgi:hypothetical protein